LAGTSILYMNTVQSPLIYVANFLNWSFEANL
jgi:hypothetical protein